MSLLEIKKYLMQTKAASLSHLCAYFKCDAEVLRNMLCHWTQKGCVRKFTQAPDCNQGCLKSCQSTVEIYEWIAFSG